MLDQKLPLVDELLVISSVLEEVGQEREKLIAIHEQDLLDSNGLVGVGNKDLEDMEALVLDHFPVVAEEVHADLEMLAPINVCSHNAVVGSV